MVEVVWSAGRQKKDYLLSEDVILNQPGSPRYRLTSRQPVWHPPTDVFETEEAFVVRVEVAGMEEENFFISMHGRMLVMRGVRPAAHERVAYHRMEVSFGEFLSEVELPVPVNPELIRAEYENGFLQIFLPKARPARIEIREEV